MCSFGSKMFPHLPFHNHSQYIHVCCCVLLVLHMLSIFFTPRSNHILWMACLEPWCSIIQIACDEYSALVPITCSHTCRQKFALAIVSHSRLLMRTLLQHFLQSRAVSFTLAGLEQRLPAGLLEWQKVVLITLCDTSVERLCMCVCLIEWMPSVCVPSPANSIKSLCLSTSAQWIILFGFALVLMVYSVVRWPASSVS